MPKADDSVAIVMAAAMNPHDPTIPATNQTLGYIRDELDRIAARRFNLSKAYDAIERRMKAAASPSA